MISPSLDIQFTLRLFYNTHPNHNKHKKTLKEHNSNAINTGVMHLNVSKVSGTLTLLLLLNQTYG